MKLFSALILFYSIVLCSCVFSPDKENFVEVDQNVPAPEISNQTLDLDSDTLFVWKYTRFSFDLKSSNQEIKATIVKYGDQELTFGNHTGSFDINPSVFPEGTHKVEIKVYTTSGTGSLADKVGAEGYEFTREWVLIVEKPKIPEIKITSTIENGYLKFSWNKIDKPYFKSYKFSAYDHGISNTYFREFSDKNTTSFIDSTFVGGKITCNLWINYFNELGYEVWVEKSYTYDFPITIKFKEDLDSLRISWNKNPFHYTKFLEYTNGPAELEIKSDTTCAIAAPGLGGAINYNLFFKPINKLAGANLAFNNYNLFTKGDNDQIKHSNVDYSQGLKSYLFKYAMYIKTLNKDFETTGTYNYPWDYTDNYTIDFSKDNKRIYSTVEGNLLTLNASGLAIVSSSNLSSAIGKDLDICLVKTLNDEVFIIGYKFNSGYYFVLYNAKTNTVIDSTDELPADFVLIGNTLFSVSPDGRYAAFSNQKGLFVYEVTNNNKLNLRYSDTNVFYGCFFDPKYPEKLILNCPNDFKVFNCSTLKFEKTIDRFYANPINIDPVTHNMLLVSNSKKKIYVYDYENDLLKVEMNHHALSTDFKLLNNIIFVNSGYHFDISSYVN